MLRRVGKFFGIDSAIYYTLLARLWGMSSGLISMWLISRYLTPLEQGFYYTFASILAFQIFFELGVGHVIMQFASHEAAHLRWSAAGVLEGDDVALSRLRSFFVLQAKWYAAIAMLIVLVVLPVGWWFLQQNSTDILVAWQFPWLLIVVTVAFNTLISPIFSLYEASGRVAEIARIRWFQALLGSLLGWGVLISGYGLFASAVVNISAIVIAVIWLRAKSLPFLKILLASDLKSSKVSWRNEIWPFQWKISVSWMSGFFIVQLFVPLLFTFRGAIEAGQMGMSLSIANAVMAIPMAWMSTKTPIFGSLIARREYKELDHTFFPSLWRSMAVLVCLSILVLLGIWSAEALKLNVAHRVIEPPALIFLMLATIINYLIFAQSVYLRAHKEEPFLIPSLVAAILVSISISLVAKPYGAIGMMLAYSMATLLVAIWCTWIFYVKRRQWHDGVSR